MPEYTWRQQRNIDMGRSPYYNDVMVEAGHMTPERAQELGEQEEARQARITPTNVYGIDISVAQNTGNTAAAKSATGMGFQDWMEAQGLWEEYLQGKHPMAMDQWSLRPAGMSGRGLYMGDEDVEGATGSTLGEKGEDDPIDPGFAVGITSTGDDRHKFDAEGKLLPSASMGEFISALQAIGIDQTFAESLWEWGMEKLLDYDYPLANLVIDVYDQDAFKQRFPAIEAMRKIENVKPPTPAEYIQFETDVSELMATYGVQGQELDFDTLVTNLMVNNVGTQEVQQRLVAANRILGNVPDEITETYMDWYGPDVAEANLMKTFLDPNDEWGGTWAEVSAETRTSEIGGWARTRLGLGRSSNVSKALASQVAEIGYTQGEIWTKLDTLSQNESLFYEKVTEERDLDIEEEGIMGAFDLDQDIEDVIEKRKQTRLAGMSGGGGAMLAGTQTGFGAANA